MRSVLRFAWMLGITLMLPASAFSHEHAHDSTARDSINAPTEEKSKESDHRHHSDEAHGGKGDGHEDHQHGHGGHAHVAPHGGTLVVFGEELAHLELVLDPKSGRLTGYVLDGSAERGVALKQSDIVLWIGLDPDSAESFRVSLGAVANVLTGETVGNTSEFTGKDDRLKSAKRFSTTIERIEVKGQGFEEVVFEFPEGNE